MSDSSQPSIFLSFSGVSGEQELSSKAVQPGPGKNWIQLLSCRFEADVNVQAQAMSGGQQSRVDFGGDAPPIEITKRSDAATVALMREALAGADAKPAVIVFVRTDGEGPTEYLRWDIQACRVVGFDFSGGSDDRAVETYLLRYTQMDLMTFAGGHGAKGAQSSATLRNGA
jgi:type VI protein secretion system component Hcp